MTVFSLTITDPQGLHARPACALAALLQRFSCNATLTCGGRSADGKDPMAVMALGAGQGRVVEFSAQGRDEQVCAKAMEEFFRSGWEA